MSTPTIESTPYPAELEDGLEDSSRADWILRAEVIVEGPGTGYDAILEDIDPMIALGRGYLISAGYGVEYAEYAAANSVPIVSKIGEQALLGIVRPTDLLEWLPSPIEVYQAIRATEAGTEP